MMSDPFRQNRNPNITDNYVPHFGNFEQPHEQSFSPIQGPSVSYDGVGLWFRQDPQDVYFHHHTAAATQPPSDMSEQNVPVKHRRTRSGCFTCRSRRVKCDETRPICDRCRKGNRECVFPQASSASKRLKDDTSVEQEVSSPQSAHHPDSTKLAPIEDISDEDELDESFRPGATDSASETIDAEQKWPKYEQSRETLPVERESSTSPSESESPRSRNEASPKQAMSSPQPRLTRLWSSLKPVEQELLQFQHDHMTHYHYFIRLDQAEFVHDTLISLALTFEPLLNAVLAFAGYHQQIRSSNGHFTKFWHYYSRSIIQLRKWLEEQRERNEAVVLTILQLAMFEEYLGDWANLVSHHRAAHSILLLLYSSDTIMNTTTSRVIFNWFARLDIFSSLMTNIPTAIDRQWLLAGLAWHQTRFDPQSIEVDTVMGYFQAKLRLIGYDMASTFTEASQTDSFSEEAAMISARIDEILVELQRFHASSQSSETLSRQGSRDQEDPIQIPNSSISLFQNDLWPLNFLWMDIYGGQQMHLYQTARILHARGELSSSMASPQIASSLINDMPRRLNRLSLVQCQIYQAIERRSSTAVGVVLGGHIQMALSTIFLGREPKLIMWARRKLANIERMGYVWPAKYRKTMAQLWDAQDVVDWWLPENEGKPSLVDEIRAIVVERTKEEAENGLEGGKDDLRELKAIFDSYGLGVTAGSIFVSDNDQAAGIVVEPDSASTHSSPDRAAVPTT